jgi:hypothetical protein
MHMPYDPNETFPLRRAEEGEGGGAPRRAGDPTPEEGPPGSTGDVREELNMEGVPRYETPYTTPM